MAADRRTRSEVVKKTRYLTLYRVTRYKKTWYEIATHWFTNKEVLRQMNQLFETSGRPVLEIRWIFKNRKEAYNKFLLAQLVG